jgi:copper(I)-binding protein
MNDCHGAALAGVALILAACGSVSSASDVMLVERPRIGATPAGADAALYVDVRSPLDDRLVEITTDASASVSLHETIDAEEGEVMAEVDSFALEAGEVLHLEPFGDHAMLGSLTADLAPGDDVELTLQFEQHEPVTVVAEVKQLLDLAWEENP